MRTQSYGDNNMNTNAVPGCPLHDNTDKRKSAPLAIANTRPDDGAHWVKNPLLAKKILGNKTARQAGAGGDVVNFKNPDSAPVFFLDGPEHFKKRRMTRRFLSPKAISDQHFVVMNKVTQDLLPERAKRQKDLGRYLSFGDGPHSCPGWQVALHETRIFLEQLFRVPGIRLQRTPALSWNAQLGSYELRDAVIACDR